MELRRGCRYALAVGTSMGLRLTPEQGKTVQSGGAFRAQATSAESNAATVSASLGLPVLALTALVKGSPISRFIGGELAARGIDVQAQELEQDGPWGVRHQINFADSGYGARGPRVWNDRAGEAGRRLDAGAFDLERIFCREGVQILHLSGIVAGLSPQSAAFCLSLARAARQNGTRVSFDLNYRASFWRGREQELRAVFRELAGLSDILVGNEEDYQLCLGIRGPAAGGERIGDSLTQFREMIARVCESFPQASIFAATLREVRSANCHLWGAMVSEEKNFFEVTPRPIGVLDRVGGGDAFVGGLLYGIARGFDLEKSLKFGWACGAMAASLDTDYAQPESEEQVFAIYRGNARITR